MNNIIIENCSKKIKNKFDLVIIAAKRTRELSTGNVKKIIDNNENDKNTIIALKEIEKECNKITQ